MIMASESKMIFYQLIHSSEWAKKKWCTDRKASCYRIWAITINTVDCRIRRCSKFNLASGWHSRLSERMILVPVFSWVSPIWGEITRRSMLRSRIRYYQWISWETWLHPFKAIARWRKWSANQWRKRLQLKSCWEAPDRCWTKQGSWGWLRITLDWRFRRRKRATVQ